MERANVLPDEEQDLDAEEATIKEGWLRKRGVKLHRWSLRYFELKGTKIQYKLRPADPKPRGNWDLASGCAVTDVLEDNKNSTGKKLFTFWVLWPSNGEKDGEEEKDETNEEGNDSDGESTTSASTKSTNLSTLRQYVKGEAKLRDVKRRKNLIEPKDNENGSNLSMGAKVAAVAIGGIMVGALTAGIGIVPYVTLVGITAVGSGAAVVFYRKPPDCRIMLSCDSMHEALAWKDALEAIINKLDGPKQRAVLPSSVDPDVVHSLIEKGGGSGPGKCVDVILGIRVMGGFQPAPGHVIRKVQMTVKCAPVTAFLGIMETPFPFGSGTIPTKVVETIDSHCDILGVQIDPENNPDVIIKISRFWRLDDDGTYLITLNTTLLEVNADAKKSISNSPSVDEADQGNLGQNSSDQMSANETKDESDNRGIHFDAVLTICPRRDQNSFLEDLRIALITCTIQVYNQDSNMKPWSERQLIGLANNYLMQAIALRDDLQAQKFENYPPSLVNTIDTSVATRQPDDSSDRADDQQNFVQGDLSLSPSVATAKAGSREDGALSAEAPQTFAGYPSWEPQPPAAALAPSSSPSRRWPRWMSSKSPSPSPTERSTKGDSPSNYSNNERTTLTQVSVTKDGAAKNGVEPSTALPASDVNAVLRSGSSGALTDRSPEKRRSINRSITEEGGAKATALRIRIAATEYEISRGETIINAEDKRARRKSTQRNSELEEIRDSLVSQKNDLEHMKKEYLALSGIPYENFSRLNDHSQAGSKTKSYPHSMPRFWTTKATAQCCKTSGKIRVMLIVLLFTALFAMCTLHAPTSMT